MKKISIYPATSSPSPEYRDLCDKGTLMNQLELHRRAAEMWRNAVTRYSLSERERDLCADNSRFHSSKIKSPIKTGEY
ncbi:TPA: hypothetical protein G8V49_001032 [Salmonella enterica]|uniref:PerC family transcriptional regulator n=1 Tax=Salmonella enterica TaxID=28901 RepID=A0A759WCG7_SALER|nr:hypothetical protein [Salmonella enterica]